MFGEAWQLHFALEDPDAIEMLETSYSLVGNSAGSLLDLWGLMEG